MHGSIDGPVGVITVVETSDATIVRLGGEIDEALREQASRSLERALERGLPVVLDAGQVRFIDSTGIAFLIQFCRIGREEGFSVRLLDPPTVVTDVLEMLGLTHVFDAVENGSPIGTGLRVQALPLRRSDREMGEEPPLVRS